MEVYQSSEAKQSKSEGMSNQGVVSWSKSEAPRVSIKACLELKLVQDQWKEPEVEAEVRTQRDRMEMSGPGQGLDKQHRKLSNQLN